MDRNVALPLIVGPDTSRVLVDKLGTKHESLEFVHTEYDIGLFREGRACMRCFEKQYEDGLSVAFPEKCSACGYLIRDEQPALFAAEFDGPTTITAPRSIAELRAEDDEQKEIARRAREGKPTSQIVVPSWARS